MRGSILCQGLVPFFLFFGFGSSSGGYSIILLKDSGPSYSRYNIPL